MHKNLHCKTWTSASPAASWLRCLLPWVMVWVLSGVGAVWGCVRVLYLWEPITPLHSPKSVSFWRHRKQADLHLYRVSTPLKVDQCFTYCGIFWNKR